MTAVDVLVVGGGPSGMAAATSAAVDGASVMLVDEWPELGGRLRYRRADVPLGGTSTNPRSLVAALAGGAETAGVRLRSGAVAWSAFSGSRGLEIGVRGNGLGAEVVTPDRLILATGTTDRAAIVPGATYPGVLTGRALQILLNVHRVRPGRRFAILGDDRVDELTSDIEAAGGDVVRVVSPSDLKSVVIHGEDGVRTISEGDARIDVDIVVTALGTSPDTQLAGMLGCELASGGAWPPRPRRAEDGSLGLPGVFACGTVAGSASIEAAIRDGAHVGRGRRAEADADALIASLAGEQVKTR